MNKDKKKNSSLSAKKIKRTAGYLLVFAVVVFLLYGTVWLLRLPKKESAVVVSNTGVHYHAKLAVTVNGEDVPVPKNVGITALNHAPMHTHDDDQVIHMEYNGTVRGSDLTLGRFFDIWGKGWTDTSFMGNPLTATATVRVIVNGEETNKGREYVMRDSDTIEVVYGSVK